MSLHCHLTAGGRWNDVMELFAQRRPDVSAEFADWGVFVGREHVREVMVDALVRLARANGAAARRLAQRRSLGRPRRVAHGERTHDAAHPGLARRDRGARAVDGCWALRPSETAKATCAQCGRGSSSARSSSSRTAGGRSFTCGWPLDSVPHSGAAGRRRRPQVRLRLPRASCRRRTSRRRGSGPTTRSTASRRTIRPHPSHTHLTAWMRPSFPKSTTWRDGSAASKTCVRSPTS